MMRVVIAVILFLYAGNQAASFFNTMSQYRSGQAMGQLLWALVAILGGGYLIKQHIKQRKNKG